MVEVDCREMTVDEQLALASAISEGLEGKAVGILKDSKIVLDLISGKVPLAEVERIVADFVSRRKDARYYSMEVVGESIIVHTPDPLARSRGRRDTGQLLPENLMKCPLFGCGFVTPYQELYDLHVRAHLA